MRHPIADCGLWIADFALRITLDAVRHRTFRKPQSAIRNAIFTLAAFLAVGCGYHVTGTQVALPPDVRSISVGTVSNLSREYGLEKTLQFALQREIVVRRQFRFSEDPGEADAVLNGTIRNVTMRPVAFDSNDEAVQYEIALTVDASLTRQHDGRVLWQVTGLREIDEYPASGNVVVTSSSQFQQGTLNASDIQNPQFNSVQLAETMRRRAINRLLAQVVRDVYNQMIEDF
jgi:outer membrane lipopolysaccharide assembly protein LptE/RlpB